MIIRAIRMDNKKRLVKKILKQCSLNHRRLRNSKRKLTFVSPVWATECAASQPAFRMAKLKPRLAFAKDVKRARFLERVGASRRRCPRNFAVFEILFGAITQERLRDERN